LQEGAEEERHDDRAALDAQAPDAIGTNGRKSHRRRQGRPVDLGEEDELRRLGAVGGNPEA
jgi:hypothetical protein